MKESCVKGSVCEGVGHHCLPVCGASCFPWWTENLGWEMPVESHYCHSYAFSYVRYRATCRSGNHGPCTLGAVNTWN